MKNPDNFNDVLNPQLRAYNRAQTALSLNQEEGADATRSYFEQFTAEERLAVSVVLLAIKKNPDNVRKYMQVIANETVH